MGQVRPAEVRRFPCVNSPIKRLNRGISMKKSKTVKMLVLAMALIMVFSVSASAATSVYWSVSGKTAHGSLGTTSASTTYETVSSDIYAEIDYYYRVGRDSDVIHNNNSSTSNAGTSAHAYTGILSSDQGQYITFHNSYGTHRVNGSSQSTVYYENI